MQQQFGTPSPQFGGAAQPPFGGSSAVGSAPAGFVPGGFWIRFVASFIDGIIVGIISNIPMIIVGVMIGLGSAAAGADPAASSMMITVFAWVFGICAGFFYYGWFYKNKGATPGKMLLGLQVVNENTGERIGYGTTFLREYIGKFIAALILMIGFIMAGLRQDKRGLHDMLAGTRVMRRS